MHAHELAEFHEVNVSIAVVVRTLDHLLDLSLVRSG